MKKAVVFGIAAAACIGIGAGAFLLRPAGLPVITSDADVFQSDRTVVVLVTGRNCDTCKATDLLLAKHAAAHPELKIVKLPIDENMTQPGVAVVVPGADGPTYRNEAVSLDESNVDAFLTQRLQAAAREKALVDKIAALKTQKSTVAKPYDDQLKDLHTRADQATAKDDAQLDALQDQVRQARAPFEAAIAQQQALLDAAAQPYDVQLLPIRDQETTALLPILTEISQAEQDMHADTALASLRAQYAAAKQAGDQVQMDAIAAQYKAAAQPYRDRIAAATKKFKEVSQQFDAQMAPINAQKDAATKQYKDAIADQQAKADAAAKPYENQIATLRADEEKLLAPFRTQAQPVIEARDKAIAPLDGQLNDAQSALAKLEQADDPQNNN